MMNGDDLIVAMNGVLFPYNQAGNMSRVVPARHVITADGWRNPRMVVAINGSVPGPLLEVHEGQTVRLHLTNKMMSEATSLHFHGQFQKGTPWMDGVSFVSQCPVLPGQTFIQEFKAEPEGTFWYHSHIGAQSAMGAHGGFVVHPRQGADPKYNNQFTMLVEEWNHDWGSTMGFLKMKYGMYVDGKKEGSKQNLAGGRYNNLNAHALLFNGRGRYRYTNGTSTGSPFENLNVTKGDRYRFRVVHSGSVFPIKVSVDQHRLRVMATDSYDLHDPPTVDAVIVNPGERFDFEVNATGEVKNYWVRGKTMAVTGYAEVEAVLHYEGADTTDPMTRPRVCTAADPCLVVNCPFLYYPAGDHTVCVNVVWLNSEPGIPADLGREARDVKEHFINMGFPGTTWTPPSMNGVNYLTPTVSAGTQPLDFSTRCPGEGYRCKEGEVCKCTGVLDLHSEDVVQLVFTNLGVGKGADHPLHMHGHGFWVLKIGYPQTDNVTGRITGDNMDINCRGNPNRTLTFCNNATWANSSWSGNTVPGLDLDRPVHKDTIDVPSGGYVVVRIKADNPGVWAMHCHINLHFEGGMFMLLNESYPLQPPPSPGVQKCGEPGKWGFTTSGSRVVSGWGVTGILLLSLMVAFRR